MGRRRLAVRPVLDTGEPSTGGIAAASRSRSRAGRTRAPRRPPRRLRAASTRPSPRTSRSAAPRATPAGRVVPVARHPVAPDHTPSASGVSGAGRARGRATTTSSVARSIVFVGMHAKYEHSPPTRRLSTSVISDVVVEPAEGADEVLAGRPSAEDDDLHLLARPFAFRKACAICCRRLLVDVDALFIACIAGSVSFAETAFTVCAKPRRRR